MTKKIEESQSPFNQYKNDVNYDMVLEGTIPYKIVGTDEGIKPEEDQLI